MAAHALRTLHPRLRQARARHQPSARVKSGRPSPERLLRTAERACLLLLLTGARSLWRSNAPAEDGAVFLSAYDLGADEQVLNAALDTTLFRGEGEAFEPLHRTIAEFLGARELTHAVIGAKDRPALQLSNRPSHSGY